MTCSLPENSELHFVSVGTVLLRDSETGKGMSSENESISHVILGTPKLTCVSLPVLYHCQRELCLNISDGFMNLY